MEMGMLFFRGGGGFLRKDGYMINTLNLGELNSISVFVADFIDSGQDVLSSLGMRINLGHCENKVIDICDIVIIFSSFSNENCGST